MKFLALALTAVVGLTEGKKIGSAEINRRMQNGLVNKSVLMRGAQPYNEAAKRKLEEEDAWEITGEYSIVFNTCTSMSVQNDQIYEDSTLSYMASNGDLVSDKDFIIFDVCKTGYCSSGSGKMTFIADVGTYFSAISQYLPSKVEQYCQACEESYDYCYAMAKGYTYYPEGYEQEEEAEEEEEEAEEEEAEEEEAEEEEADEAEEEAEEGEGERKKKRKLAQNEIVKFIDCDMCAEYECLDFHQSSKGYYDEDGEYVEAQLDDAMEWLNGFSECSETSAYLENYPVYAGLMCNAKGTGIEIGLFMDDECTLYTPTLAYKNIMETSDIVYYNMVSDVVEFTFNNDGIECYNPEVTWYNEVDYYYEQMEKAANGEEEEEEAEDEEYEAPEAAEWCQGIVGDDSSAPLYGCDIEYDDDAAEEEEEEQDEDGNGYPVDYELDEEAMDDISSVCAVYTGMTAPAYAKTSSSSSSSSSSSGSSPTYTPHTIYNPKHETLFDYSKGSAAATTGKVFGYIVLVGVVGAGAAYFFMQKKGASDKKAPLIAETEGTMA